MKLSLLHLACLVGHSAFCAVAFEGTIVVSLNSGNHAETCHYTVGTNRLRIERTETNRPYAINLVELDTGTVALVFPRNHSFVRLKDSPPAVGPAGAPVPVPGNSPGTSPVATGRANSAGMHPVPGLPGAAGAGRPGAMSQTAMWQFMAPHGETFELKSTGQRTNVLGYDCERFTIQGQGEVMEIWATDKLLPFYAWRSQQLPRSARRRLVEQWGDLLCDRKLFPLRAVLTIEDGPERLRFEVTTVTPAKIEDKNGALFQPPADYNENEPMPF
jgi:uncharacterized protein DUF4412